MRKIDIPEKCSILVRVAWAHEEFITTLQNKRFDLAVSEAEKVLKKKYEKNSIQSIPVSVMMK